MSKNSQITGHDGPYDSPVKLPAKKVLKSWIDYNGHMNVAFYTMAIDKSLDIFLEKTLGLGESHANKNDQGPFVVQANFHYLNEMKYKDKFFVQVTLIDFDEKKMHLCLEIILEEKQIVMAISEQLMLNVNLIKRKTEPYPNWAIKRLMLMKENHKNVKLPPNVGRKILIKK